MMPKSSSSSSKLSEQAAHLRQVLAPEAPTPDAAESFADLTPQEIQVKAINAKVHNVRRTVDPMELAQLQASLQQYGMLQPVIVQPIPGKRAGHQYQLVAGFRRVTAAKALGWESVPAQVLARPLTAQERVAVQLTENLQRESMTVRDIVQSIETLQEDHLSLSQMADILGLGVSTVRLYAQLGTILRDHPKLWSFFDKGLISIEQFRAAYRLLTKLREKAGERIQDPAQLEIIHAEAEELFVRVLEKLATTQPLTVKRVTQEVSRWLTTLGLEEPAATNSPSRTGQPLKAVLGAYQKFDLHQLASPDLEEFISLTEQKLDAAKARLEELANA